ncbi:hypothetical protein ACIQKE_03925 [Streptomyces griseoviridis]|uniref:Carboxypeptidase regulatory-like domain-containing protein n=2 Tax=Streptomyces TaxID=1883 RepID=A0A3S9ZPA0_STRGD|nr:MULTISPECIES: hypothetical protein [Streptomyces]AZS89706.1 hypothetical protein ELQ87_04525 [Streptomyces griseoviridis]MDT0473219.1 hypothetical protein [Streptomyces sp. DSM 41014]QCN90930.1 hypothetical protein DDJ31_34830 [Streptomyces griseoviridis]
MDDLSGTGGRDGEDSFAVEEPALGRLDGELRGAAAVLDPVPTALEQLAVEAFALHDLDARIAELTFDSVTDAIPVRGAVEAPRMLTFQADGLTVDVELTGHGLMGQVLPPQTAAIEVLSGPRAGSSLTTDPLGRFTSQEPPSGPFALRLRTGGGVLVTDWLTA